MSTWAATSIPTLSNPDCSMSDTQRIALFVGSFDPFTEGHADIASRALQLFDRLVIGIGVNPEKKYLFSEEERLAAIRQRYAGNQRISVEVYHDMTIDLARRTGASCIVKGVRTMKDFLYERRQAEYNYEHGGIETLLFPARKELKLVSSSRIRKKLTKK